MRFASPTFLVPVISTIPVISTVGRNLCSIVQRFLAVARNGNAVARNDNLMFCQQLQIVLLAPARSSCMFLARKKRNLPAPNAGTCVTALSIALNYMRVLAYQSIKFKNSIY
jgi:hypothetical protein